MLLKRPLCIEYALRCCRGSGEIGARLLLFLQRPSERDAVGLHARLRRLGDLRAREVLRKGEKLREKIEEQLAKLQKLPGLIRSFFNAPSVAYIGDR